MLARFGIAFGVTAGLVGGLLAASGVAVADEWSPLVRIARAFVQAKNSGLAHDGAIEEGVVHVFTPLQSVEEKYQQDSFAMACDALNMYQLGKVSSIDEAADWVSTQGNSGYARAQAVRQFAESLVDLNEAPKTLVQQDASGGVENSVEVTGSGLCLFK
jgi:hypothetical protein